MEEVIIVVSGIIIWLIISTFFEVVFRIAVWPFVSLARAMFFVISRGRFNCSHTKCLKHPGIQAISFIIFCLAVLFIHVYYGSQIYGRDS